MNQEKQGRCVKRPEWRKKTKQHTANTPKVEGKVALVVGAMLPAGGGVGGRGAMHTSTAAMNCCELLRWWQGRGGRERGGTQGQRGIGSPGSSGGSGAEGGDLHGGGRPPPRGAGHTQHYSVPGPPSRSITHTETQETTIIAHTEINHGNFTH